MARRLGIKDRTYRNYEKGVTVPAELVGAIRLAIPKVNIDWLLTGQGEMYGPPISNLRTQVPDLDGASAVDLAEATARRVRAELAARPWPGIHVDAKFVTPAEAAAIRRRGGRPPTPIVGVPLLADAAAAGPPAEVRDEEIEDYCLIYAGWIPHPKETTCVRIHGDSMEPIFREGSIVAVDHTRRDPRELDGRIVAARHDDGVTVKWLRLAEGGGLVLWPQNEAYPPIVLAAEGLTDEAESPIIGQVIWSWSSFQ